MRIHIESTFLDGRDRFEEGDTRSVPDADAARFIAAGWARPVDGEAVAADTPATSDLTINNGQLGLGDNHG